MDTVQAWLSLLSIKGLGEASLKRLYNAFGSARAILSADEVKLAEVVGKAKAKAIVGIEDVDEELRRLLNTIQDKGIRTITYEDEDYPAGFMRLKDPPPVLFLRGSLKDVPLVGIVGSRKANTYTRSFLGSFVKHCVDAGYGVVSGGAMGVDAWAHEETIKNSGYSVCILGFGILKARGYLFESILKSNGVLISEFKPHVGGDRYTFPKRNRLIAALSEFLVVPEAGAKSGALITARYANELGKKVYVHIGIGKSPDWDGCYTLLREQGAYILKDGSELFGDRASVHERDSLTDYLKTPRTLQEVADFLGCDEGGAMELLSRLEIEGKIHRVGAFYTS